MVYGERGVLQCGVPKDVQLQRDLDRYVESYNRQRDHQGYRTQGRTPYSASG